MASRPTEDGDDLASADDALRSTSPVIDGLVHTVVDRSMSEDDDCCSLSSSSGTLLSTGNLSLLAPATPRTRRERLGSAPSPRTQAIRSLLASSAALLGHQKQQQPQQQQQQQQQPVDAHDAAPTPVLQDVNVIQ